MDAKNIVELGKGLGGGQVVATASSYICAAV